MDITSPLSFKEQLIQMNQLNLFSGINSSGKSFIHAVMFACVTCINYKIAIGLDTDTINYIFSRCIDNNIVGKVGIKMKDVSADFTFDENGLCTSFSIDDVSNYMTTDFKYLSSNTRTFEQLKNYLTLRKVYESSSKDHAYVLEKLLNSYKMYDVMLIEGIILRCPITISQDKIESLGNFSSSLIDIIKVDVDLEDCDFIFTYKNGSTKKGTQFSKGEQSILVMFCLT